MTLLSRVLGFAVLLLIFAAWEMSGRLGLITSEQLPVPTSILAGGWSESLSGDLQEQALLTLRHLAVGFAIAAIVAIPLGFALGRFRLLYAALEPVVEFLRPMPVIAILPIAVLFLGLGNPMIYAVIAFGSGWIILLHAMDGARGVDPILLDTGRTFQVSRLRRFFTILLPAAAPQIFTGLRIGLGIAVIVTVVVELMSGFAGGLGNYIGELQGALRTPEAYAAIVVIAAMGFFLGQIFSLLEYYLMAWHRGFKAK